MSNITFVSEKAASFFTTSQVEEMKGKALKARETLVAKNGLGNDFLGWIDLPANFDAKELEKIQSAAKQITSDSEVLLVIGIGGSYLGARAAIEFLRHSFYNGIDAKERKTPEIYFVGNSISATYMAHLKDVIGDRDFSINMISKSGTTTEPAIAFRVFKQLLEKKYGKEAAAKRIYATTDKARGALKQSADKAGYPTFVIPDDVGGRFSVLTAVGLLPIAVSGADIARLLEGAKAQREEVLKESYENNGCLQYAVMRNIFLSQGKNIELLANYEPALHYFVEWWKQLFGESEGKDKKGIFPAGADFTCDLHSMGQYIQDGQRILFETILNLENGKEEILIEEMEEDIDGLNYLTGQSLDFVNKNAMNGTILAHTDGGVPNLIVNIKDSDEFTLGQLIYFFEFACAVSGYILEVNPFDQPGVESYKRNMFALLGKPGFEADREALLKRL